MSYDLYEEDYEDFDEVPAPKRRKPAGTSSASRSAGAKRPVSGAKRPAQSAASPARRPASGGKSAPPARKARPAASYKNAPRPKARRRKPRANPMVTLLWWVIAVSVAFAVSFALRTYVFDFVSVSGDAMYESMMAGDVVLIDKLAYGERAPQRGEVVALRVPNQKGVILRRIVGLPGETIRLSGGETYVNDSVLYEQYVGLKNYESYPAMTLAADRYYVLGDNRSEEMDSRDERIGLVGRSQIEGRATYVVWPLNHLGSF